MGAITSRKPSVDAAIKADIECSESWLNWFRQGEQAFANGVTVCPIRRPDRKSWRHAWWNGWYSAQIGRNLEPVFRRNRITWP